MTNLGCIDCPPNTFYRPEVAYIYNGNSYCDVCLRKKQEENGELPKPIGLQP